MKQNKYDEENFFSQYSQMSRSMEGLEAAGEWPAFRSLLPDFRNRKVLDLGCGFGWHCRYAREQGARSVIGIDLSDKMLTRAKEMTNDDAVEYQKGAIEDIDFPDESFDIVMSSLAFHYVQHFDELCRKVHQCLSPGGAFVFSVEHPMFTALPAQDWHYGENGDRLHWPLDDYQKEGLRITSFLADDVKKYHRTIETYVNTLIDSGFILKKLAEPAPPEEMQRENASMRDEARRPMFLLLSAGK